MRSKSAQPEMNVTPLVDVVLVLLIIFMVIVPQMAAGAAVDVPAAANFDPNTPKEKPLTVSVSKAGAVFVDKKPVEIAELSRVLVELRKRDPHRSVRLKADHAARYGDVRQVFAVCQSAGFPGIALQVGDRKPKGEPNGL